MAYSNFVATTLYSNVNLHTWAQCDVLYVQCMSMYKCVCMHDYRCEGLSAVE